MGVLVSATEGGGIARCGEEVQIFGRRRREIDEPTKPISLTEGVVYDENIHTSGSSCRGKGRVLPVAGS